MGCKQVLLNKTVNRKRSHSHSYSFMWKGFVKISDLCFTKIFK